MKKSIQMSLMAAIVVATVIFGFLFYLMPSQASPEYEYTIRQIFKWLLLASALAIPYAAIICGIKNKWLIIGSLFCLAPILVPKFVTVDWRLLLAFSLCWMISTFSFGILCFRYAKSHDNAISWLAPVLGTVLLVFTGCEAYLLCTAQPRDGIYGDSGSSSHIAKGRETPPDMIRLKTGEIVDTHGQPYAMTHKILKYDNTLFDALYNFDEFGHRIAPRAANAKTTLMLFGCSFTFGYGLMDEETWPWLLGEDLGPQWQIINYAYNGFGSQQMYSLLLNHELNPLPATANKEALFLAIWDHSYRASGLFGGPASQRFRLEDGKLILDGYSDDTPLKLIPALPDMFNGSQAMREASAYIISSFRSRLEEEYTKIYVAQIVESARLLKEEYNARLTVLLWPDIEKIASPLQEAGIPVLFASAFLGDFEFNTYTYYISRFEMHPNTQATKKLAVGLAEYFRGLVKGETK